MENASNYGTIGIVLVISLAAFRVLEGIVNKILSYGKRTYNDADALRIEEIHRSVCESQKLLERLVIIQEQQAEILKRLEKEK